MEKSILWGRKRAKKSTEFSWNDFGMSCDNGEGSVDANKKKVGIWARNKLTYIG